MVKKQIPKNITFNLGSGITPPSSPREELTGRERYELHFKQQQEERKLKDLPQFGSTTLKIPPFFAVPTKKGWRLANPLTEIRNLAQRQHKLSVRVKRANVKKPELDFSIPRTAPKLEDFPPKDRAKLEAYYTAVKEGKVEEYMTKNKPRGFPATLYKNAKKAGYTETTDKVYTKNEKKVKVPSGKPRGRPSKQPRQVIIRNYDDDDIVSHIARQHTEAEIERSNKEEQERQEKRKKEEVVADIKKHIEKLNREHTKEDQKTIKADIQRLKEAREGIGSAFKEETRELMNELIHIYNEKRGKGLRKINVEDKNCEAEGGSLLGHIAHKAYDLLVKPKVEQAKKTIHRITHPSETIQEVKDFGRHLIHGRHDAYPPSAQKVIDENKDAIVQSITLHRNPLPSAYTKIMSWATKGETDKRIKEQPKDTLYHIGMWVKLSNGKTIKVEKNEVINIDANPKKPKEEEVFQVPSPPPNLTFGEMLSKTREAVGDHKFFSYSAKDNNCGNFIEYILKTNGMDSQATHDFIGQDAKAILKGFPSLRKFMNTLTDTAGRANVLLEGGDIDAQGAEIIDWEDNIKWGSFTKQFEKYKEEHPNSKIDDLEHFAESILAKPEDYRKTTLKRARFYLNVIAKKKISHHNNIMPTQGGRMIGLSRPAILPAHIGHPALVSDQYPRIPQAFTQVHLAHPVPIGHGLYAGGSGGDLLDDIYGGARHMLGVGLFDDIGRALDPKRNGVAKAFDPKQNGVANAVNKTFTPQLGRDITSGLIHKALPAVISGVADSATSALTGNPALGFAVGQTAGKYAGKEAGDALGKATGYGLGSGMKRPHLVKGSKEAKEYMASIRRKKGSKGGAIPAPHSRSPITDPSLL